VPDRCDPRLGIKSDSAKTKTLFFHDGKMRIPMPESGSMEFISCGIQY